MRKKFYIKKNGYFKKRFDQFKVLEKKEIAVVPKNALIELTNACNHSCGLFR